ncbi:MAG: DUF86 domain-containing protein [Methanothrix sp.]|nr:DUF86 domain-containing protein [Methanothrix sp.]
MKPARRYIDFLQDIVDNLEKAESFVEEMDFGEFQEDEKTRYSLICALEIVGEAAKKVPTAVRQRNPQVPWKDMAGMRDRLIHGYFGVDNEIVWKTAKEFAPQIRSEIETILSFERSKEKRKE